MSDYRDRAELLATHNYIYPIREGVLNKWGKVMNGIMQNDPIVSARYSKEKRDNIELWLASVSGTIRASFWITGKEGFEESLKPLDPDYVDKLHISWWTEADSRPFGEIPRGIWAGNKDINGLRPKDDVRFLYKHATKVHSRMWNIHRLHPGNWHPDFHQRVLTNLMFYDGAIRYLGYSIYEYDKEKALYSFNTKVVEAIHRALDNAGLFHLDVLPSANNESIGARDHSRDEFEA